MRIALKRYIKKMTMNFLYLAIFEFL